MKRERKFKFVGDPGNYRNEFTTNKVYYGNSNIKGWKPVSELAFMFVKDWEEVTEPEQIPNQDQPASSMTKFEKCVIDIIGNIYSNINIKTQTPTYQEISQIAINQAKEIFKQLEKCQE